MIHSPISWFLTCKMLLYGNRLFKLWHWTWQWTTAAAVFSCRHVEGAMLFTLKAGAGEMLISAGHKARRMHGSKTAEPQSWMAFRSEALKLLEPQRRLRLYLFSLCMLHNSPPPPERQTFVCLCVCALRGSEWKALLSGLVLEDTSLCVVLQIGEPPLSLMSLYTVSLSSPPLYNSLRP